MKVLCLVGSSGVGKTTLLEQTIALAKRRGRRLLAVKSSHHPFVDEPGSDSFRLSQAGADGVVLLGASGARLFLDPPLALPELLQLLASRYDLALIEGGKSTPYPKIELVGDRPPLLSFDQAVAHLARGRLDQAARLAERLLELAERRGQFLPAANP